jgi:hypothetical protein
MKFNGTQNEWVDVEELAKDPQRNITPILVLSDDEIYDSQGNVVKGIKKGNPFVLVSGDKSLETSKQIIEYFKK